MLKKNDKSALIKCAENLTDEELENEYYKAVFDCLGSEVDEMYERGYDFCDIAEREIYEKYLSEKADVLGSICFGRGIVLWDGYG